MPLQRQWCKKEKEKEKKKERATAKGQHRLVCLCPTVVLMESDASPRRRQIYPTIS
jgi:hypothetical protein